MNTLRVVVDTNIHYQAIYDPESRQMRLFHTAAQGEVELYSPFFVKEEALRVFERDGFRDYANKVETLPVTWVPFELYSEFMPEASKLIAHKPDEHAVACALYLNCGIITANTRHFNNRRLKAKIRLWKIGDLLKEIMLERF